MAEVQAPEPAAGKAGWGRTGRRLFWPGGLSARLLVLTTLFVALAGVFILPPALAARARVTGRVVQLKAHDAAEVERDLGVLRQAGVRVEDLEIGRADLEDVFLEIMGERAEAVAA